LNAQPVAVELLVEMKIVLNWQRRAVVLLAGSLIVLSVILAVFAIREANREKLLKEKETEEEQLLAADTVASQANALIFEAEQKAAKLLENLRTVDSQDKWIPLLRTIVESEKLVSEVFLADENGKITFPHVRPLYFRPGEEIGAKEVSSDLERNSLWRRAENAEFRTKNYAEAIDSYQRLMAGTSDQGMKALLLSRVGRCFEKMGNIPKSIEIYRKILETGPPDLAAEGIPLQVIARYQILTIYLDTGRMEEASAALLEFRRGLVDSRWPLTRHQFDYYTRSIAERFETIAGEADPSEKAKDYRLKWAELSRLQEARLSQQKILENVRLRIAPRLSAKRNENGTDPVKFSHISDSSADVLLLVSYAWLDEKMAFGLILNPEMLAQQLLPPDGAKGFLREGRHLQVVDEYGHLVAGEDISPAGSSPSRLSFAGVFEENFPPWKINVYQTGPDPAKRQFQLRRNIYIFSVFIVVAALFLGGFLAIRGTAKELKLAKLKSDFVSTVSHEFRTPLMSIRYLSELLQRGRVPDDQRKQEYYETITGESERLGRLVENILDFSKIESGLKEYRTEETDIVALVGEVASRFERQAALKEFALKTEIAENAPRIAVDKEALSRALFNLLDNAVKYSSENPRIVLRVRNDANHILLEVEDNGIGISRSEQQRIFEKFYRSEQAMEGDVKGSGIGLTLVDHIVKAHGGDIILQSEPGKGTKVTIRLPLRSSPTKNGERDG
jgi:signal transduction histidine kinase